MSFASILGSIIQLLLGSMSLWVTNTLEAATLLVPIGEGDGVHSGYAAGDSNTLIFSCTELDLTSVPE